MRYDIFISYKRKSLATANNLYYRLTTRGYTAFFDLEEMRRDNFDAQLLRHIDEANDVFVLLEEGSLDACHNPIWKEDDWFCREVAYALERGKNIIPVLLNGYQMPPKETLPPELKELTLKNAPEFSFSFIDAYLDRLIEKEYITSKSRTEERVTSIFKFYSDDNCQIFKDGKLICAIEGDSREPYYFPVYRKGEYRFECKNTVTGKVQHQIETIDFNEEKVVEVKWKQGASLFKKTHGNRGCSISIAIMLIIICLVALPLVYYTFNSESDKDGGEPPRVPSDTLMIPVGEDTIRMIHVEAGSFIMGEKSDSNASPRHEVLISKDYYIGETEVTQAIWINVMGYNPSCYEDPMKPVENVSWKDCKEFILKLNEKTGMKFRLPSEAEWEFAARGGNKSCGYRYSGSNNANDVAWYYSNTDSTTHTVGMKQPNELGLYDMSGNVWEWCEDWYGEYISSVQTDPKGPARGTSRILRGGSCMRSVSRCRITYRGNGAPNYGNCNHGLRLVLPVRGRGY